MTTSDITVPLDMEIGSVRVECHECEHKYIEFTDDTAIPSAVEYCELHEADTGHDSFDVDVQVIEKCREIDMTITVGNS